MTYRERREAKAERLRGWADGRDAKANAARTRVDQIGGMIPLGQPILVGHHSEGRHRRDLNRIDGAMRQTVEHQDKAREMRSRAANIEAQAERAIYDDDPDAIERLRERIAELEAQRERIKARNAEYRKAHRDELRGMTPYGRDQVLPHPSYVLTNLGGNIGRYRKRLARLEAAERDAGQ